MSAALYLRALVKRQTAAPVPRLERVLGPAVADERLLSRFRKLTSYPDDGFLPLTWPYAWTFKTHLANMVDPLFPLPLMGTVHIRTRIRQSRPVGAGEALRAVCVINGQRETPKGLEFDLETRAYAGADLVWEGTATMLRKDGREPPPRTGVDRPPLDGLGAVNRVWKVPATVARDFAGVSGDLNPIHLSPLTARFFGFPGIVAHGMWSLTRAAGEHPELVKRPGVELSCDLKTAIVLPARVISRHWPDRGSDTIHLRLLNARATKPHLIGRLVGGVAAHNPYGVGGNAPSGVRGGAPEEITTGANQ